MSLGTNRETKPSKQSLSSVPVADGSTVGFTEFRYKIETYCEGLGAWHGEVVRLAFADPAQANTKYPYDRVKARECEEKELPEEPDSEDTPGTDDESASETEAETEAKKTDLARRAKRAEARKGSMKKPDNWDRMREDEKRLWREKATKRVKRERSRHSKKIYTLRVRNLKAEKRYYERMRELLLCLSIAFSKPSVVQYMRTKDPKGPIEMIAAYREKWGSVSGIHKHILADRFDTTYPKPWMDVDDWLTRYVALKNEVESQRTNPFEEMDLTRKLLIKLSKHPAYSDFRTIYQNLPSHLRPTHDQLIENAREQWASWKSKNWKKTEHNSHDNRKKEKEHKRGERTDQDKQQNNSNLMLKAKDFVKYEKGKTDKSGGKPEWWLKVTCYGCYKIGHTAKFCPESKSRKERGQAKVPKTKESKETKKSDKKQSKEQESAFIRTESFEDSDSERDMALMFWVTKTRAGTTDPMTRDEGRNRSVGEVEGEGPPEPSRGTLPEYSEGKREGPPELLRCASSEVRGEKVRDKEETAASASPLVSNPLTTTLVPGPVQTLVSLILPHHRTLKLSLELILLTILAL